MRRDEATRLAGIVLDLRARRADHLPSVLFGEGAWALLLVLFIADADCEPLSPDQACRRAGGTPTVASRWLSVLEQYGLATSAADRQGRQFVALTPRGVEAVEACMEDAQSQMMAKPIVN